MKKELKRISSFDVPTGSTATVSGSVTKTYLHRYNPSIVYAPAYSITLKDPQIIKSSNPRLTKYLQYKFRTNPRGRGITLAYKPAIHPKHRIVSPELKASDLEPGRKVWVDVKAVQAHLLNRAQLSLMIILIHK